MAFAGAYGSQGFRAYRVYRVQDSGVRAEGSSVSGSV